MKNKFLAFGAALLLLASCSSDDSSGSVDESLLIKKWYNVSYKVGGNTFPYDDHEECGKDYIEFKADGEFRFVDVWDCEEEVEMAVYTVNGNKVTVDDGIDSQTITISKLTSSALEIKVKYDFDDDGTDDNVTEIYTSTP